MNRLDEVLEQLVVVKVLDRTGPGAVEHARYLKRDIVYIEGQGFKWLEDPKHLEDRCEASELPGQQGSREDPEVLDELEDVEAKLYQQDTGISTHVSSGRFDIQFCVKKAERDDDEATKAGQSPTGQAGKISCGHAEAHAQIRSAKIQRHRENSRRRRLGWKRGTVLHPCRT